MDYMKQVREMMTHLSHHPESMQENMRLMFTALGDGIAKTMALIEGHDEMHKFLDIYLAGVAAASCLNHKSFSEFKNKEDSNDEAMDMQIFLRDVFKPTGTND